MRGSERGTTEGIQQKRRQSSLRVGKQAPSLAFRVAVVTGLGMKPSKKPPPSAELISVSSAFAEEPTITVRFRFAAASQALYFLRARDAVHDGHEEVHDADVIGTSGKHV